MIKFEHTDVMGWEAAIRGMRNPMNSWQKSDSFDKNHYKPLIGDNDLFLMRNLCDAGTDHRKFMRMITVYVDITAPLYWWKEFDTYKVGTVANSCSTMHKIADKEFTREDFSHENLLSDVNTCGTELVDTAGEDTAIFVTPFSLLDITIGCLNNYRLRYLQTKDKIWWWQMIQLLPSSYNQRRTVMLNYEVLANIYKSRSGHKLDEWRAFCGWIERLPYSELMTEKGAVNER